MKRFLVALFWLLLPIVGSAASFNSDGSLSDTQSKVNSAVDGDEVVLPAGTYTWNGQLTISGKGITLRGAGGGGYVDSASNGITMGTGTKTFTVTSGLPLSNGDSLIVSLKNKYPASDGHFYMVGTVSSYSGTTLQVSVSAATGSGTFTNWYINKAPTTEILNGYNGAGENNLISITRDATHHVRLLDFKLSAGGGMGSDETHVIVSGSITDKVPLFGRMWFATSGNLRAILWNTQGGVLYKCTFDENYRETVDDILVFKPIDYTAAWTSVTKWGNADTDGTANTYVEECYFLSIAASGIDIDDNATVVVRHSLFDNTGWGSHGKDTSPYGMMAAEVYSNRFVFNNMWSNTVNLNWTIYMRGGSWVICSNVMHDIDSSAYGNKVELRPTLFSIRRNSSYNCPGGYPCDAQLGRGYVTAYNDLVPVYVWENTGFAGANTMTATDYAADEQGLGRTMVPTYWQEGRDYYYSAKPGWVPYTFPHPLRDDASDGIVPTVDTVTVSANGTTWTFACSEAVTIGAGGNGGFTTSMSGGAVTLTYAFGSGTASLVYTGSRTVTSGETGTLTYTQPGNGVEDIAGNDLVTFVGKTVVNNSSQTVGGTATFGHGNPKGRTR